MDTLENLTIMFTDIVGYSDLVEELSRTDSQKLLEKHNKILNNVIKHFGGKKIKSIGDSFLVTFRSPTDAVICGMAMHDALWDKQKIEEQIPNNPTIVIRVAINTGEVILRHNDIFGEAVNIASRVEEITPPGSVYLTESVYLSMKKSEATLTLIDSFDFKGISENIRVYQAKHKPIKHSNPDIDGHTSDFPYGGAHISYQVNSLPWATIGKYCTAICALFIIIFITWWITITYMRPTKILEREKIIVEYRTIDSIKPPFLTTMESTHQNIKDNAEQVKFEQQALALLASNNYLGLEKLINNHQDWEEENAYLPLLSAHSDFYFKRYTSALDNYRLALQKNPLFAEDRLTANNLVSLLEYERQASNRLIAQHLNPTLIDQLGKRTGQKGLKGRYDAFYLLKDSGNMEYIDRVGLNIWDLKELDQCQHKRTAILELKRLGDKRALSALKESLNVNFFDRIKYACLLKDAQEAINNMEKTPSSKTSTKKEIPIDYKNQ
ncbi:hypothetical protein AB835_02405 [Candidatus Endobugula sertula]|uniref:Guanylate cyclase domain-containing protein n=1 Tax=Candidatus Endobugula sertula TaxID=62101 RepID=A0A1D2QT40_9GAMM|nr:hypothetical protein AB835_02405 [Candidatus Endobugula sertula]